MNTPTASPPPTDAKPASSPVGPTPTPSPISSPPQTESPKESDAQMHPGGLPQVNPDKTKESYEVPTVGIPQPPQPPSPTPSVGPAPTIGGIGTVGAPQAVAANPTLSPAAPVKSGGRSPLLPIVFVVVGIILLGIYALVWAVIFGLPLPFLPL